MGLDLVQGAGAGLVQWGLGSCGDAQWQEGSCGELEELQGMDASVAAGGVGSLGLSLYCLPTPPSAPTFLLLQRADVWACGVLLCTMLMGSCPFQRPEDAGLDKKGRMRALLRVSWGPEGQGRCAGHLRLAAICMGATDMWKGGRHWRGLSALPALTESRHQRA